MGNICDMNMLHLCNLLKVCLGAGFKIRVKREDEPATPSDTICIRLVIYFICIMPHAETKYRGNCQQWKEFKTGEERV
jgi:hypothetical protein